MIITYIFLLTANAKKASVPQKKCAVFFKQKDSA